MNYLKTLEFDVILNKLAEHAHTHAAKDKCLSLVPYLSEREANINLNETTQAKQIIEYAGTPPLDAMQDIGKLLTLVEIGEDMLTPEQIWKFYSLLASCKRMKKYLKRAESTCSEIADYGGSIIDLSELQTEIDRCIYNGQVSDKASNTLYSIRRKIDNTSGQIKAKLNTVLSKNKTWFSDYYVSVRSGHYTLPVKREYKSNVVGTVIDTSNSGGTYFIEPMSVTKLQQELSDLAIEEDMEVRRILYTLTAEIGNAALEIRYNIETMEKLDFLFAKAQLSIELKASSVKLTTERTIRLQNARHPLLDIKTVVPLNFVLEGDIRGIVITGPNTGGKTVALKTVGLLSIMAQSGLHVPADGESMLSLCNLVLCDIGDGQSISENLSTFSSHMKNIIEILKTASCESLVLLDELGSGTDPAEGMGLAVAILEELCQRECLFVSTTHYPEVKGFVAGREGIQNARMAFDKQSLMPLYHIEIGEAGESCALYIAERLGMQDHILRNAEKVAYSVSNSKNLVEIDLGQFLKSEYVPCYSSAPKVVCDKPSKVVSSRAMSFNVGDTVMIYPQKSLGIVFAKANDSGEVGIQVYKNKKRIHYRKIRLHKKTTESYPENYDFSLVFEEIKDPKVERLIKKHKKNEVSTYS